MGMKLVAIITQYVYGTSGTELPPPAQKYRTAILPREGETNNDFLGRITTLCMKRRNVADNSHQDGWDWEFVKVDEDPS
jgi:hypothetical protein